MEITDICNLAVATIRVRPWGVNEAIGSALVACDNETFKGMLTRDDIINTLENVLTEEVIDHSGYEKKPYALFDLAMSAKAMEMSNENTINVPYRGRFVELNTKRLIDYIRFKLCR